MRLHWLSSLIAFILTARNAIVDLYPKKFKITEECLEYMRSNHTFIIHFDFGLYRKNVNNSISSNL